MGADERAQVRGPHACRPFSSRRQARALTHSSRVRLALTLTSDAVLQRSLRLRLQGSWRGSSPHLRGCRHDPHQGFVLSSPAQHQLTLTCRRGWYWKRHRGRPPRPLGVDSDPSRVHDDRGRALLVRKGAVGTVRAPQAGRQSRSPTRRHVLGWRNRYSRRRCCAFVLLGRERGGS